MAGLESLPPQAARAAQWGAGLLLLWLGLRWFERANLYMPARALDGDPAAAGMPFDEVEFRAEDGVPLHAWFVAASTGAPVPGRAEPPVLILFHGNAGNISHRLEKLRLFRDMGVSVFLFDYRGYGKSRGRPSERGTYLDGRAAVAYLERERSIPPSRMIYYGESLGCAVALETALASPPRALVLDSPFTSTVAMGRLVFPFLPVSAIVRYRYDNLAKIPRLVSPLLVVHSEEDEIVPFAMGRALYESAQGKKSLLRTRGDHNGGFLSSPRWSEGIRAFIFEP